MTLIFVDTEATTASPITGVMTEFGMVEYNSRETFHGILWDAKPSAKNPAVPVLTGWKTYDQLGVLKDTIAWLDRFPKPLVMISDNPAFDFMWMACFFDKWAEPNPFGHSARRIGDFYAGLTGDWRGANRKWKRLRDTPHTHNPVDDAMGNAEAFAKIVKQFIINL